MSLPRITVPHNLDEWQSSSDYQQENLDITPQKFLEVTNLLLENPNLNSTHLFRADIVFDTAHILRTNAEKESCDGDGHKFVGKRLETEGLQQQETLSINGAKLRRTVKRRLIPRKPQLDSPLLQTCYVYELESGGYVVIYLPHAENGEDMPWYHPSVRALAYIFRYDHDHFDSATLSIRYVPFQHYGNLLPDRLHRTFVSLLRTFIRLARNRTRSPLRNVSESEPNINQKSLATAHKDTIIPQHLVQDTYSNLKRKYASDLISRWVEKTEPSKHVFEDIMIAAFLIELWKQMYQHTSLPNFVDIACGNGVLVYILRQEGYHGFGLDARRRKTWDMLGLGDLLEEKILIPKPFFDTLGPAAKNALPDALIHDGIFSSNTFIISNHADELTPWTPILAALSSLTNPLPFLAIPCCSHALSGAKHRYYAKDAVLASKVEEKEEQSSSGDLRTLREQKAKAATHGDDKSMYACLTRKVVAIAQDLDIDTEMTLMRIPSTRNIGVVGNRRRAIRQREIVQHGVAKPRLRLPSKDEKIEETSDKANPSKAMEVEHDSRLVNVQNLLERECAVGGGVLASAQTWIERAKKLQTGKGRGKVNLGHKPTLELDKSL